MAPLSRLSCWALLIPLGLLAQPAAAADLPLPEGLRAREVQRLNQDAMIKAERGDYDGAVASVSRAIALTPDSGDHYAWRANLRGLKGDYAGLIDDYERALRLGVVPESLPIIYWNRALGYEQLGRLERASEDFGRVVELNDSTDARLYRGRCYVRLGKWKRALKDYDYLLAKSPGEPRLLGWRGLARVYAGEYRGAVEDLTRLIEKAPPGWGTRTPTLLHPVFAHYLRGRAYLMLCKFEEADADFSRAIELDDTATRYPFYRAVARLRLADLRGAKADAFRVLRVALMKLLWEMRNRARTPEATG